MDARASPPVDKFRQAMTNHDLARQVCPEGKNDAGAADSGRADRDAADGRLPDRPAIFHAGFRLGGGAVARREPPGGARALSLGRGLARRQVGHRLQRHVAARRSQPGQQARPRARGGVRRLRAGALLRPRHAQMADRASTAARSISAPSTPAASSWRGRDCSMAIAPPRIGRDWTLSAKPFRRSRPTAACS